ncbi:hypothetical protein [Ammoniphilus sp. YIM 78166]|nr:hypothetical protein [Ammoniphilus sp. YIM 78166]
MGSYRNIHRVEQLTGVLFRLGILTSDEEKDIREKIAKLRSSNRQSKIK